MIMRKVAVVGIGQTRVGELWDESLRLLAGEAGMAAMKDCAAESVDAIYIGNMMSGSANKQQQLGAYIADWMGKRFVEAFHVEAACSSGAAAFRTGVMAVASGQVDSALVIGVEKMTDSPADEITASLATAADADWEVDEGVSFVALNALLMHRYMHEYGWKKCDFASFSINAHANGVHNPHARFHEPITLEKYEKASMICDPINLLDASPIGDGSAAAYLVPFDQVHTYEKKPRIWVAASTAATDTISIHDRQEPTWLSAAESSAKKAYAQSGLSASDMDLFELHDAFSIMAALSLEACGFAERGTGPRLAAAGEITPQGRIPIATRGGLKARGHPVGATGMYQIVEVVQQLRGECGATQVPNARTGMAQNIGGSGSNIITHILLRE
jgi:acetyl-CoA C-acetyltransferase